MHLNKIDKMQHSWVMLWLLMVYSSAHPCLNVPLCLMHHGVPTQSTLNPASLFLRAKPQLALASPSHCLPPSFQILSSAVTTRIMRNTRVVTNISGTMEINVEVTAERSSSCILGSSLYDPATWQMCFDLRQLQLQMCLVLFVASKIPKEYEPLSRKAFHHIG